MKDLSSTTKLYILCIILIGFGLIVWMTMRLDWSNTWLYLLAALGAVAQTLKVEGPTNRTNYSIAWFVYGFTFIAFGVAATVFVILVSHLVEWIWHKYPWYIQVFNIGNHVIAVCLAGLVFTLLNRGSQVLNLTDALALAAANLTFVFVNHFLLAVVVKLARGQSFAEIGPLRIPDPVPRFHGAIHGGGDRPDLAGQPVCLPAEHPAPLFALSSPACACPDTPVVKHEKNQRLN